MLVAPGNGSAERDPPRSTPNQAAKFAYAADNERFWLVLRPQVGASPTPPRDATLASLLAGA